MNKFSIKYKDQMLEVKKTKSGMYRVTLPFRQTASGKFVYEKIENEGENWKFISNGIDVQDCYTVFVQGDGSIVYTDESKNYTRIFDYKYGETPNTNKITDAAEKVYDVVKEICTKDVLGINPENLLKLRRERLKSSLKLLGFDSIEDAQKGWFSSGYVELSRVGKMLEDYKSLSFVKSSNTNGGFSLELPKSYNISNIPEYINSNIDTQKMDNEYFEIQNENLSSIRGLKEDYCLNMKKKVTPDEWILYSKTVSETANLLLSLNYDLLTDDEKKQVGVKDFTNLSESEVSDKISNLIDSRRFNEATDIENRFVISEANQFSEKIDSLEIDDPRVQASTSIVSRIEELRREVFRTRSEKERLHGNYEELSKLYKSKCIIIDHCTKPRDTKSKSKDEEDGVDYV